MWIGIVTPAPGDRQQGNGVTAARWARLLAELGHRVDVSGGWSREGWDVLIALHARRSHPAAAAYRAAHPSRPLIVALTGTDLYVDLPRGDRDAERTIAMADLLVTLQPHAANALGERAMSILQSAEAPADRHPAQPGRFEVLVIANLRPVKDPLLTQRAAARLPPRSTVQVVHIGRALDPALEAAAQAPSPRYTWLGPRPADETRRRLAGAQLLALTSRSEGGANVLSEAIVCGVPAVATRIDGTVGMLGEDYPGLFEVGDADGLAALMARAETDAMYYAELQARFDRLRPRFHPDREREAWARALARVGVSSARS